MTTLLSLIKFKISFLAALTASIGSILAVERFYPLTSRSATSLISTIGVFILACGASILNHYQDRRIDNMMDRTRNRPIPSGKIQPDTALLLSILFIAAGVLILHLYSGTIPTILGIFAVIWYNGVYAFLKRKTVFAVLPGSLIGAIPPVIGWISVGGKIYDPLIITIAFFFFMWQIPHFYLHFMVYSKDYEKSGTPSISKFLTSGQLKRVVFIWLISSSAAGILIPFFYITHLSTGCILLLGASLWLVISSSKLLKKECEEKHFRLIFKEINYYVLTVVLSLALDNTHFFV